MNRIIYAHLGCPYCEYLSNELKKETTRNSDASGGQLGFDDHWARYENINDKE